MVMWPLCCYANFVYAVSYIINYLYILTHLSSDQHTEVAS